ncbi:MAG TPA: ubiquitin-like protein Pup [Actinomycetota bacterium]|jgi:ubiquitin-like protein Pup|nr:ubiquitin-like protein Pup [Actinomycetota bacterium]
MSSSGGQTRKKRDKEENTQPQAETASTKEDATKDVDELLDEIDEVLETNAEDFVRSYIQKGGQ